MHRNFALHKFRRNIEGCSDVKELQKISVNLLQLYLRQQDTVNQLIKKGWLPSDAAN